MSRRPARASVAPAPRPWTADSRLALRKGEAAKALGISDEAFDAHVKPHVPVVRLGSLRLYAIADLERFLLDRASAPAKDCAPGMPAPPRARMADGERDRGARGQRGASHDDEGER